MKITVTHQGSTLTFEGEVSPEEYDKMLDKMIAKVKALAASNPATWTTPSPSVWPTYPLQPPVWYSTAQSSAGLTVDGSSLDKINWTPTHQSTTLAQ